MAHSAPAATAGKRKLVVPVGLFTPLWKIRCVSKVNGASILNASRQFGLKTALSVRGRVHVLVDLPVGVPLPCGINDIAPCHSKPQLLVRACEMVWADVQEEQDATLGRLSAAVHCSNTGDRLQTIWIGERIVPEGVCYALFTRELERGRPFCHTVISGSRTTQPVVVSNSLVFDSHTRTFTFKMTGVTADHGFSEAIEHAIRRARQSADIIRPYGLLPRK